MRGQLQVDAVQQDGCTLAAVHMTFLTQGCNLSKDRHCRNDYDPILTITRRIKPRCLPPMQFGDRWRLPTRSL